MRYTCGYEDSEEYIKSAQEVATYLKLAANRHSRSIESDFIRALDFGCGTGRLIGALDFGSSKVTGVDVGKRVVDFTAKAYPHHDILHTELLPPLPFDNCNFDLIYSFSVFSHLSKDVENEWLKELARVATFDGLILITIQGDWMIEATLSH